jgi:hypothetical protein
MKGGTLWRCLIGVLITGIWMAASCDNGTLTDGDGDSDSDADSDADGDGEGCPLNSGVPCACDLEFGQPCEDDSVCIKLRNIDPEPVLGFCSERCSCDDYDQECSSNEFGADSMCIMAGEWPITDTTVCNCLLINCESEADCPTGHGCFDIERTHGEHEGEVVGVCHP